MESNDGPAPTPAACPGYEPRGGLVLGHYCRHCRGSEAEHAAGGPAPTPAPHEFDRGVSGTCVHVSADNLYCWKPADHPVHGVPGQDAPPCHSGQTDAVDTARMRESFAGACAPDRDHVYALCNALDQAREDIADLSMLLERLDKPVINTYRWEDVKRYVEMEKRVKKLEAKLDAVGAALLDQHFDSYASLWRSVKQALTDE